MDRMSDKTMTPEAATALRRPFPPESIGRLPKGGQMLDYAGHAAVTDRLLAVDPTWSWEPLALGPDGLPAYDSGGNLWIKLTICGVSRLGVGDGKNAKEVIGDAIRNGAMRFGVGLDLWAKENLVEFAQAASHHVEPEPARGSTPARTDGGATEKQIRMMGALMGKRPDLKERDAALAYVEKVIHHAVSSRNDLSAKQASDVIDRLQQDEAAADHEAMAGDPA